MVLQNKIDTAEYVQDAGTAGTAGTEQPCPFFSSLVWVTSAPCPTSARSGRTTRTISGSHEPVERCAP